MVVEDPDGGGRPPTRNDRVAILRPEYTDTDETAILSRISTYDWRPGQVISVLRARRALALLVKYFTLALSSYT